MRPLLVRPWQRVLRPEVLLRLPMLSAGVAQEPRRPHTPQNERDDGQRSDHEDRHGMVATGRPFPHGNRL